MGYLIPNSSMPELSDALSRDRLHPVLDCIPKKKLSLFIAGAGYGKTILAAQTLVRHGLQYLWFRSDETDKDLELEQLIHCLVPGIQLYYPDFCLEKDIKPFPEDKALISGNGKMPPVSAGEAFCRALEARLSSDLFLVIDDSRQICQNPVIKPFIQLLLDRFIPGFHLILISRVLPDLKLSRLMAKQQVVRILEPDLAFTREEIRGLYTLFNIALSEENIGLLFDRTGGWVSGLVLFHQSLGKKTGPEMGEAVSRLKGSHRLIADYFNENILSPLAEEERQFLLKTSILSGLHTEFCNGFLDIDNARAMLCGFEDRHCFVFSADEDRNRFFFHGLFQQFLQDRLQLELGIKETGRLYNRAALLYEKNNQGQEALRHHILAGNLEDASRLLNRFARPIVKQDQPQVLKSLLSVVPAHYMDDEPWFQYLQAGYYGLCSQLQLAVNAYEKVLEKFRSNRDEQGECLCLMELAEYYLTAGKLKKSEQAYQRILGKDRLGPYLTIIVMGHLIRVLALSRRTGEADKYAKKAIALLPELDDETSLKMGRAWIYVAQGYRYLFSGSYQQAMALGEESKPLFKALGEFRFMFSSFFLISYSSFYLGRFSRGMAAAEEGLAIARGKGVFDEFSEFLRLLRAKNCLEQEQVSPGQLDRVLEDCEKSLVSFEASAFPGGVAQTYLVLHRVCRIRGDIHGAEKSLRKGMAAIREDDMPLVKNELHLALSQLLLFDRGRKREALVLLKDAEKELLYSGWHISWVSRIYARYYWEHGHRETAYKYMVHSLKICEEEAFDAWLVADKNWVVPLLTALYSMGTMASYLEAIFRKMGDSARPVLTRIRAGGRKKDQKAAAQLLTLTPKPAPPPIRALFFERFRLFAGTREIRADHWKSRKAKNLFKYLLSMRHKGYVDKEILMELLWPDEDPKKSNQRFHVAMASIRKTLEPDIPKGVRSSYIKRSGQSYRIHIGESGRVDVEEFSRHIRAGNAAGHSAKAILHYKKAQSLFQGDFLEEDIYEDWCARERERYKQEYLGVLKKIIQFNEHQKDYAGCITVANTFLENDPYAEGMVRRLMAYYAWAGNKAMVSRVYKKFSSAMKAELNCGVSEKTRGLYENLVHSGEDVWDTAVLQAFKIPGSL